ncbi:MAG TPA: hypothetical protein VNE21_03700, partial [Mycobacteriales bacterium]|nr:hypothetical protein [Mycobacteriales bacterium]
MRQRPRLAFAATAVGLLAAVSGCAGGPVRADSQPAIPATTTPSPSVDRTVTGTYRPLAAPTGEPSRPPSSPARPPAVPGFHSSVAPVTAAALPYSYRAGCPVPPAQLRLLHLRFWGFDATSHVGVLVVNAAVVPAVLAIFREL